MSDRYVTCIVLDFEKGDEIPAAVVPAYRVPTGQGKLEKVREFEWSAKGQGEIFCVCKSQRKVRENEELVPPDVRFSG